MATSDYDPEEWARQTALGRRVFNHNFRMGRGPAGWTLLKAVPMAHNANRAETTWLWQAKGAPGEALVQVNVTELPDWRAAQKHLVALLANCMRPAIPRGARGLAKVGDAIFVANDPVHDRPAAAQFVRGNIAAAIRSVGSATVDVSPFVQFLDRMLISTSPRNALQRTALRSVAGTVAGERGGTVVPVDLEPSGPWLKLIASGGELRRRGRSIEHVASEPGVATIEIFAGGR